MSDSALTPRSPAPTERARRPRWRLAIAALLTAALAACGGGGGGGGGDDDSGSGGSGGTSELSGRLWHSNYALDYIDGTQIADLGGAAPTLVDADKVARPWPDGSQYAIYNYDDERDGDTVLRIKRTSDGTTLYSAVISGYAADLRPSPANKAVLLVSQAEDYTSSLSATDYVFVDLANLRELDRISGVRTVVDWLPDGRYLHLAADGTLSVGQIGGSRSTVAKLNLGGRGIVDLAVDPLGLRYLVTLVSYTSAGNVDDLDLWVGGVDGSALERLTATGLTSYGRWSPDGERVAFDVDTGTVCSGSACMGTCEIWYAPASGRNLNPLPAAPGAAAMFKVRDRRSSARDHTLGCELLGWTR